MYKGKFPLTILIW